MADFQIHAEITPINLIRTHVTWHMQTLETYANIRESFTLLAVAALTSEYNLGQKVPWSSNLCLEIKHWLSNAPLPEARLWGWFHPPLRWWEIRPIPSNHMPEMCNHTATAKVITVVVSIPPPWTELQPYNTGSTGKSCVWSSYRNSPEHCSQYSRSKQVSWRGGRCDQLQMGWGCRCMTSEHVQLGLFELEGWAILLFRLLFIILQHTGLFSTVFLVTKKVVSVRKV